MNDVSYFPIITSDVLKEITWQELCTLIKSDEKVKASTRALRDATSSNRWDLNRPEHKRLYQKLKVESLSGFMPGGIFLTKNIVDLVTYSQIVHVDFDHLSLHEEELLRQFIKTEPSVCLSFVSPGGMGRKIFHRVRPAHPITEVEPEVIQAFHTVAFESVTALYEKAGLLFHGFDKSVSNLNRACYLSSDPDAYVCEQPESLIVDFNIEDHKKKVEKKNQAVELEEWYLPNAKAFMEVNPREASRCVEGLISWLQKNSISITHEYEKWFRVIFALKASFDEETAKKYARQFSQMDSSYNETDFEKKFHQQIKLDKAPSLGTIFYFAKEVGYHIPEKRQAGFIFHSHFIKELSKHGWKIRYNEFTGYLERYEFNNWNRFTDRDLDKIKAGVFGHQYLRNNVQETINLIAPEYNPIKRLMESMQTWDGHDHLSDLCRTLNCNDVKWPLIFLRKWLVGLLAGLTVPDHYNENVLILQGGQGDGKTRWIRRIFSEAFTSFGLESERYFKQKQINPENKDDLLLLCTSFVVFFDEMNSIVNSKADIEAFKNMMSATALTIRKPYGRHSEDFRRYASVIATVNESQFLADSTGNRRFWIIPVGQINQNHSVNIPQVFAQAWHLLKSGERHYLSSEEIKELNETYLPEFEMVKAEEELIRLCVVPSDIKLMTATQIMMAINAISHDVIKCGAGNFGRMLKKHFGDRFVHNKHGRFYKVNVLEPSSEIFTQRYHTERESFLKEEVAIKALAVEAADFLEPLSEPNSCPPNASGLLDSELIYQNIDKYRTVPRS